MIEPIFAECYPAKPKGHYHMDLRRVLNGSIFRLRTGCHWHQLPKRFGDDSTGANGHDAKWLAAILEAIVVERPQPTEEKPQPLCLDKGDNNPTGRETVATCPYIPHSRRIGEETLGSDGQKIYSPRRWVVERTLAWFAKCRGLLVWYEKKAINFLSLLQLACALLWMRRRARLIGD